MQPYQRTVIVRHRRENLKKCSLRGLESRSDMLFITYPYRQLPSMPGYIVLSLNGPPLSIADRGQGLLLIDGTWRYASTMFNVISADTPLIERSLPAGWLTAYPRRQDDCQEPSRGLASVEALFSAYSILGYPTEGLLEHYHWREKFLELNRSKCLPIQV
jgi:pre-rRNA-processing protein TSR3